jgi:hypothetical protein
MQAIFGSIVQLKVLMVFFGALDFSACWQMVQDVALYPLSGAAFRLSDNV